MDTFTDAVETFLNEATWLTDADAPMVTALRHAAHTLDTDGVQAALLNTFGVTYRTLAKGANSKQDQSEAEAFLNDL